MQLKSNQILIFLVVFAAAFFRLIPHPFNFTPIGAMALFGAAYFSNKYLKLFLPLAAMYLSDLILNNTIHSSWYARNGLYFGFNTGVYISFILIAVLGIYLLQKVNLRNVIVASLSSSLLFYLVTNFAAWVEDIGNLYTNDLSGLMSCYIAGLPFYSAEIASPLGFLGNTILGDFFFCGVLFGAYYMVSKVAQKFKLA
jgi:hypothetical protein